MNDVLTEPQIEPQIEPLDEVSVAEVLTTRSQVAMQTENELFMLRGSIELLWLEVGAVAHHILKEKLYKYLKDSQGNYYRTAKAYFAELEQRFQERGWSLSRATLYRFADDYGLFVEGLGLDTQTCRTLGKTALQALAPGVRKLLGTPEGQEKAGELVQEVLTAIEAQQGLPKQLVEEAVDDATGRIMKSLQVTYRPTAFGYRVDKITLWWDRSPLDVASCVLTREQMEWFSQRLGQRAPHDDELR